MSDAAAMEACLLAVAEAGTDIRHALFDRFLAAYPARRPVFLNLDAASRRMTDETLQMLFGLARGEGWVWLQIAELVGNHRNYGALSLAEYDDFIEWTVEELARAAGPAWSAEAAAAWERQAAELKLLVRRAQAEWASALSA
ncbi:MAG TPA: hypothetical protein PKD99_07300 [Sphingopyxis sp.]|nr:hypothetical protein [Sphingopyxis sp.]HMP44896.1 hypothetical protein [Sphingopyxis sp.]HMQ18129.1 hypothetical protein [Sphingopyxis sp.]